jgi:hypothetical protein
MLPISGAQHVHGILPLIGVWGVVERRGQRGGGTGSGEMGLKAVCRHPVRRRARHKPIDRAPTSWARFHCRVVGGGRGMMQAVRMGGGGGQCGACAGKGPGHKAATC